MSLPRILMFCAEYPPRASGAGIQTAKLSRALAGLGCRVELLTPLYDPSRPREEDSGGVTVRRYPLTGLADRLVRIPGLGVLDRMRATRRAVAERIRDFDLLFALLATDLAAYALDAARRCGRPAVCRPGDSGDRFELKRFKRSRLLEWWLHRLYRRVDRWVAVSGAVRDDLLGFGVPPERITDIPNGTEIPHRPSALRSVRRFLYLGRLSLDAPRDLPCLLKAFDRLASESDTAELAMVGGGASEELRAQLRALRNPGRVRMPGFQDPGEWLAWADCFVLPSRWEGMSNALLEAMSAGLACVASDIGPNREALDDGRAGMLVPVGDEDALYAALRRLHRDAGEARRLGAAARERARSSYDITQVALRHLELYQRLTARSAGS